MNLDRAVLSFAGFMVLVSVALTQYVSHWFVLFTIFIGLNLLQTGFTRKCPAAMIFKRLFGVKSGCAFE
ncbi:DUF2892 domain-containing protein [Acidocella sp.]|jgi:hypothetical protein|uniref:YgaP family membrane protein n=1 Tax=Acidocella sp. TaxID=50710 RepID=UPI002602A34F|nr:DUF2892 domain-containing protein [Acidocella sp.]